MEGIMRVLAFNGSPRPKGNTSTIISAILEGAKEGGAETTHVMLDEIDLKGCQGCLSCRKNPGNCARQDGLRPYLEELKLCDAVVVACPIYMYRIAGQMKLLVDRLYSFWENTPDGGYTSALPPGKRFALVTSQGHPDPEMYRRSVRWLGGMVGGLDMEEVGRIVHTNSADNPARDDTELLEEARRIGLALAGKPVA
jgi:multimeric flavodoxin WrbA